MASWSFLDPWFNAFLSYVSVEQPSRMFQRLAELHGPAHHQAVSMAHRIDKISIEWSSLRSLSNLPCFHQAIDLVGLALRIDPRLWAKIPLGHFHAPHVEPRLLDENDLNACFAFKWSWPADEASEFAQWLQTVGTLLRAKSMHSGLDYNGAKQQLLRMDPVGAARASRWRVPCSLRVRVSDAGALEQLVLMLESVMSMEQSSNATLRPALLLSHITLTVVRLDAPITALLARITGMGVEIRQLRVYPNDGGTANMDLAAHEACGVLVKSLHVSCPCDTVWARDVYTTLVSPLGARTINLDVEMPGDTKCDWLLLCRTLRFAIAQSNVRQLHVDSSSATAKCIAQLSQILSTDPPDLPLATPVRMNSRTRAALAWAAATAIHETTALSAILGKTMALVFLPNGERVEVPRSYVVVDTTTRDGADQHTSSGSVCPQDARLSVRWSLRSYDHPSSSSVISLLRVCLSSRLASLVSLELRIAWSKWHFTDADIETILQMCPALVALSLSPSVVATMDVFLDAYRDGCCRLRVLSIYVDPFGFLPFVNALAVPTSAIARTLEELSIDFPSTRHRGDDEGEGEQYRQAVVRMLAQNQHLHLLRFHMSHATKTEINLTATALRPCHRILLPKPSRRSMPMAAKLAFVGAMLGPRDNHDSRSSSSSSSNTRPIKVRRRFTNEEIVASLDRDTVALVLAFAMPRALRIVQISRQHVGFSLEGAVQI